MFFKKLETNRLILKNININDREFIFRHFSNSDVNEYLFDAEPLTDIEGADEIINYYTKPEPRESHRWILILKNTNKKIGTCGFHCWNNKKNKVDIGYDLKKEFWGNGYMQEAIKAILEFAKNKMKINEINAHIYYKNNNSIRLVHKFGFMSSESYNCKFRGKEYLHNIFKLYLDK